MNFLRNFFSGVVIGVANIIPGVSGGTMAVVLGMYDRLIGSVSTLFQHFKKNLLFLIPVGLGGGIGIVLFSKLVKYLLEGYPMPTNFFFLGLIAGSMPMIYKRAVVKPFKAVLLLPMLCAFGVMLLFTFAFAASDSDPIMRGLDFLTIVRLVISSALAAACMILPGISGSMVLMLLGVYTSVLTAISEFNLLFLIPVLLGIVIGLLGGAKIIDLCLRRAPQATYCAILGLILGSVIPVFINAGFRLDAAAIWAVAALAAGAGLSVLLGALQKRLDAKAPQTASPESETRPETA